MDYLEIATLDIEGARLDAPTYSQLGAMGMLFDDGRNHQICFVSARNIGRIDKGDEYASMVASADLALPTSFPASRSTRGTDAEGARRRRIPVPSKHQPYIESIEFDGGAPPSVYSPLKTLSSVLSGIERTAGSLFLVGGKFAALQRAESNLRATFPALRIVGRAPGDYDSSEESAIVRAMQKSTPDVIVVGSFVAGGELWIPRHMVYSRSGLFMYSESIIEVLAGTR